jgi:hypothetical protein
LYVVSKLRLNFSNKIYIFLLPLMHLVVARFDILQYFFPFYSRIPPSILGIVEIVSTTI